VTFTRLVVGDRFGTAIAELPVSVDFASWRLNKIGQCKFTIAANDPKAIATNLRFGNRVLLDFENGLPDWGGILDPPRTWTETGEIEMTAYSAEHILKYRTTDKGRYFTNQTVGAIFRSLIEEMNAVSNTGIVIGEVWTGGTNHSPDYHFKSIFEIVQKSLTQRLSTYDFDIVPSVVDGVITFIANFYESKGTNQTGIALVQDKNLAKVKLKEQGPIVNSWDVAGEGTGWGNERLTANEQSAASIDMYGFRENSKVYGDVSVQETLDEHATNLIGDSANPYNIYTLQALDKKPALFSQYDVGDSISLLAHDYGFGGTETTIRILSREFTPRTGRCGLVVQEEM
jgi:hypothetical protein